MTLSSILASHETRSVTLTVFAPEPVPELEAAFDLPGVDVDWQALPDDDTGGFATVSEDDTFLGSVPVDALRSLVDAGSPPEPGVPPSGERPLRRLFELLRDVTFRSFDRGQLLATAREFEDRAVRIGEGSLHAGFQRPAALRAQAGLYEAIATDTDLDVHVYVDGEWDRPALDGVTVHEGTDTELGEFWFVAFDGGPDPQSACGMLAEERPEGYFGFWTYDPITVNELLTHLRDTY